jgi:hypothetical protein
MLQAMPVNVINVNTMCRMANPFAALDIMRRRNTTPSIDNTDA